MPRRTAMALIYVGDVGVIPEPVQYQKVDLQANDIDSMTWRELFNYGLSVGLDARDMLAVRSCLFHIEMIELADKEFPRGYNLCESSVYCKNCWRFFRDK